MKVAVEGCCHGELDQTYAELERLEQKTQQKADVLIICGDFQAIRNQSDLLCMAVPPKYRQLGQFHSYYTGEKVAPILTIVVGGNHEASNYLWELYHGGWLAPNIYYLGGSGCVRVNGIRISGASGIYKNHDYNLGHYERLPYDNSSMRSVYHVRSYDVYKLSLLTPGPQVFISHDWPAGIHDHGDVNGLLRAKPFFKDDIRKGELGNPHMMTLMKTLRPLWWFAAHLHVRFQAEYDHVGVGVSEWGKAAAIGVFKGDNRGRGRGRGDRGGWGRGRGRGGPPQPLNTDEIVMEEEEEEPTTSLNPDSIDMGDEESEGGAEKATEPSIDASIEAPLGAAQTEDGTKDSLPTSTKFLALDKCVPRRAFLEIITIQSPDVSEPTTSSSSLPRNVRFTFDNEWLAISRALHPLLSTDRRAATLPNPTLTKEWVVKEATWIKQKIQEVTEDRDTIDISTVQRFCMTAPGPGNHINPRDHPLWYTNPQTEAFCDLIGVGNRVNPKPQ